MRLLSSDGFWVELSGPRDFSALVVISYSLISVGSMAPRASALEFARAVSRRSACEGLRSECCDS